MGDGASFSCGREEGMVIICRGMVYAKMFCGGMVLFYGGMAYPLNSQQNVYFVASIARCITASMAHK